MTVSDLPVIGSVGDVELEPEAFAPGAVVKGSPLMTNCDLHVSEDERTFSGIWSVTPGTFHDVMDGDETFVVLAGRMTVAPGDGSPPFEVKAGDVCVFPAGYRSVWTVRETIVKGYHIELPEEA
jgi:uncharacterized cupin superfamily protein